GKSGKNILMFVGTKCFTPLKKGIAFAEVELMFFLSSAHRIENIIFEFKLGKKQIIAIGKRGLHKNFTLCKNIGIKRNGFFYFLGFFVHKKKSGNNFLCIIYRVNI